MRHDRAAEAARVTDLEWMERHLRCMYVHDANDRIVRTREPDGRPAARFHLGRTRLGNLWRMRADLASDTAIGLARLAGREPALVPRSEPPDPPERLESMRRLLARERRVETEWAGPAFRFPAELREGPGIPTGLVVRVLPDDEALLERHFAWAIPELGAVQPCAACVVDGHAVALCHSARPLSLQGTPDSIASEAGVETVEAYRGRGYAAAAVAAWARAVRGLGGAPLYSTAWTNAASRGVARKLGLLCYGEDVHLT